MWFHAATLLAISVGFVLGSPASRNTQEAVQQDISEIAQNLFMAGRSTMPDFESFAKLLNSDQAKEAVSNPSVKNLEGLGRSDVESLRQMFDQSLDSAKVTANLMQQRERRAV